VSFAEHESAVAAFQKMDGRFFDQRRIEAAWDDP
jgi:hypothetical protein